MTQDPDYDENLTEHTKEVTPLDRLEDCQRLMWFRNVLGYLSESRNDYDDVPFDS